MPDSLPILRVISLDRTPQRFEQFLALNPAIEVSRFPACDGALLNVADCIRDGLVTERNAYVPGALGTALSHVTLWRECVAAGAPIHIAEDDVILRDDFWRHVETMLGTVPAWDIVLWSHNFDWPVMVAPAPGTGRAVLQYLEPGNAMDQTAFRSSAAPSHLLPLHSAAGIGCYSLSPTGAAHLLEHCLPIGIAMAEYATRPGTGWENTGIDVEMSRHYAAMAAFVAVPPLALAPNDQEASTIRGRLAALHDLGG
jgi:GR25 family glycosyltransferase involved in LPS biosynthesis